MAAGPGHRPERRSSVQRGLGQPGTTRRLLRLGLRTPVSLEWDLAFTAFAWVPLHARHVVRAEGFTDFGDRSRRLRLFLAKYGWSGHLEAFLEIVQARVLASAVGIEHNARRGDPVYQHILEAGVADSLRIAAAEVAQDALGLVKPSL